MRRVLQVSNVLSWINLIFWGLVSFLFLLLGALGGMFPFLVIGFFLSAVALHSYAALQLHKSLRNPAIPLGGQTPTGIRFIGFVALFFGIGCTINSFTILRNPGESLKLMQSQMAQAKVITIPAIRTWCLITLMLGLSIVVNVFLNFRLLRWYYFIKAGEKNEK